MSICKFEWFEALFRQHGRELLAFAGRRVGKDRAEDVVQEAYLRLLQHPNPEAIANPRAYLHTIAVNLGADYFQRERRLALHHAEDAVDLDSVACPQPGPEAATAGRLRLAQFERVLDELPELQRHAFILHKLDGLTYPQVAKALGISPKTAQRYILKAWQHCLLRLGQDG